MKSFLTYIEEDMVNYNHVNQHWQLRHDSEGHGFKSEHPHLILKDGRPHVDYDAHEAGKRVHAYIHGTPAKSIPAGHTKREIKFNPGNLDHPFIHKDDNSPVTHAHYVEFNGKTVHAHYKS
jgi:hypothetical protein